MRRITYIDTLAFAFLLALITWMAFMVVLIRNPRLSSEVKYHMMPDKEWRPNK
jgi:hypothetical protein